MYPKSVKNKKGAILVVSYVVVLILLLLGAMFFARSIGESRTAERQKRAVQAFSIAEGGLERALYDLRQDFENGSDPSWADGEINGIACGPDTVNFYPLPYTSTLLGNGFYSVELKNVVGEDNEIWVRSTGAIGDIAKVIQTYVKIDNFTPWNNAIFAGAGSAGTVINGNVDIRGSVHILGTGLESYDLAIDMSGSANIGNNYEGLSPELRDKIPPCPTTLFNSETVESLEASLRIKRGMAGLNGSATVGKPDTLGNSYKETMDGVYITDGYGGDEGGKNVYSDNGTQNTYDLGDKVTFFSLDDPYNGYFTYNDYLRDNALVLSDSAQLNKIAHLTPTSTFSYTDPEGKGSISMDGDGNLTIDGIVYIDGGDLNMDKAGSNKTITYSGKGSILVTGNVGVNVNLLTNGNNSFPINILGIMTPNSIDFNAADIDVMGVFYAENLITVQKQTDIAGILISNYFDMGQNVPSVYQIPEIANNPPPGMITREPIWIMRTIGWQEL